MAHALTQVSGPAAPIMVANINTDTIAPMYSPGAADKPRTLSISIDGMAQMLFANWRYDTNDKELPDFVLNRPPFRLAKFIIAGPNFGCGSSRDSAAKMLFAFGIRCVIAPGFGEIFRDNCFKLAMLPLVLEDALVRDLADEARDGAPFTLDAVAQELRTPGGRIVAFDLPEYRREQLTSGLDDIALTRRRQDAIAAHQSRERGTRPWTFMS
jgi:3-isopropylmalate dehydratase small subunit